MTIQNFSLVAGDSRTITATVDNITNLSNVSFNVNKNGISVLSKQIITLANTLTISLDPSDTQNLSGNYDYEIIQTDDLGNVTTLISGTLSIRPGDGITAQQVFLTAMSIMDVVSQDGTYNGYPDEYKRKAWPILTLLQSELTPGSMTPSIVTDENSLFYVDDRTCLSVLPYGLAAHLLFTDDQVRAGFFNNRYDELKRKRPSVIIPITDVYGFNQTTTRVTTTTTPTLAPDIHIIIDGGEV